MRFNLLAKYFCMYVAITVLGFIGVTFLSYNIDYHNVNNKYADALYKQAISVSNTYASDYFSEEHMRVVEKQLQNIATLSSTRIMFIDALGNVILDTDYQGTVNADGTLYSISDFDYTSLGTNYTQIGNLYGVFDEQELSAFAPITSAFTLKGYVVVSMPESLINDNVYVTFNTNYFTLVMILFLSLGFLFLYLVYIHKPVTGIIKATSEYGKGNLGYKINPGHNDEIGRLAISLNYMASELNEMDKFQQKFLSNISHDFRSPLTSIKGYLEAIADGTIPPEMVNKYIDIVLFETDRLTKLTSNILTLNEMDPKTVRLEISVFDINSIIRHIIETFEGACKKKKVQFQLTFSGGTQDVRADKSKIQQVIYNLLDNAIKFSPENSCIFITVREKGEKVYISVKDTGVGIAKESLDKIWDRFYKSDASRGRDKKGSGLGLSITKEIIQAHDEHIDVISTPGVGTEFTFTLPIVRKEEV